MRTQVQRLRVLITAGPTHEYIDPVRFLSNPSTGQMGYALASAAAASGADVTLISGPVALACPKKVKRVSVVSAAEMLQATLQFALQADLIIACAAVADYRSARVQRKKMKKTGNELTLRLVPTVDILKTLGARKQVTAYLVGFAAETHKVTANARAKLERKNLDMIVANHVRTGNAFGAAVNAVTVLYRDGRCLDLPSQQKPRLARQLWRLVLQDFQER